jgi:Glu-tRNA(Gln) amidotransferase subunit E-like FAD-binding protein
MKEFIDKLIERLEEEKKYCSYNPQIRDEAINKSISIVNELAEEYGKDTNVTTNADKIRSMTDEELAEFISSLIRNAHEYLTSEGNWLIWLQSEAE